MNAFSGLWIQKSSPIPTSFLFFICQNRTFVHQSDEFWLPFCFSDYHFKRSINPFYLGLQCYLWYGQKAIYSEILCFLSSLAKGITFLVLCPFFTFFLILASLLGQLFYLFLFLIIYLFLRESEHAQVHTCVYVGRGRRRKDNLKEATTPPRSLMQGSISGPWNHELKSGVQCLADWPTQMPLTNP